MAFYNAGGGLIGGVPTLIQTVTPNSTGVLASATVAVPTAAVAYAVGFQYSAAGSSVIVRADQFGTFENYPPALGTPPWSLGGFTNAATTTIEVQYSDDGGVTWTDTRNGSAIPVPYLPATAEATVDDYEAEPGVVRSYRARVQGLSGIPSVAAIVPGAWSAVESDAATSTQGKVFIQDPLDPTTAVGCVLTGDWKLTIPEKMQRYFPIGRKFGIKATDGTKGIGGSVDLQVSNHDDRLRLLALLAGTQTMLLQLPAEQYYISIDGDRTGSVTWPTMGETDDFELSNIAVPYVQAAMP